jgi:hypothetical protein
MDWNPHSNLPWGDRIPRPNNRGLSDAFGYIVALGMLTTLIIAFYASMPAVTQGADLAQRDQMQSEGQKLSGQIVTVDRLVRSSNSDGQIGRHISLSERIGNQKYTISVLSNGDDQQLLLETVSSEMQVRIPVKTETPITETTIPGGDLYIVRYNGENNITLVSEE